MKSLRTKLLYVSLALCAGRAHALGLGDAIGTAVIGEPLHIEIPLFGGGSVAPSPACFKVAPPMAEIGGEFVLRNARVDVVGGQGASRLLVTTAAPVREPLVGFAISAGCEFGLARDYVLLSSVPSPAVVAAPAAAPAMPAAAPASVPAEAPMAAAPAAAPAALARTEGPSASETLRLENDATLTALARQKYPLQPKAREKFVRMMLQANPDLADPEAVIAAGKVLNVPPGLPVRREGSLAQPKPAPAPEPAVQPAAAAAKRKPNPGNDRLVLGAAPSKSTEAQLLDEAERLTDILLTQTKTQEELLETIGRLEKSYAELRKEFVRVEGQLAAVEAQRKAEKAAAAQSFDLATLIAAVLGGGAMGGLLLHAYQRRRPRADAGAGAAPWWMTSEKAPEKPRLKLKSAVQAQPAEEGDALDFHTQPGTKS